MDIDEKLKCIDTDFAQEVLKLYDQYCSKKMAVKDAEIEKLKAELARYWMKETP